LLYAVHPIFFQWSTELIRDQTFWFLFTCTLYFQWRAVTEMRWRHFLAAGMAMTLAVLTRFEGLFLLIPLVFWTIWRYRALNEKNLRRQLIAGMTLAVAAFPAVIVLVNVLWLGRHTNWVFSRLSPFTMFAEWWQGLLNPIAAPLGLPVEMQNPSFLRLVEIFVPALVKGLAPLFAVPMLIGLWKWRRLWARRDQQPLFYTSLIVLGAAWVHAWCGRESCDRYYLPIVLMALPFAALGILAVCRKFLIWSESISLRKPFVRLAVAAPLVLVLLGNAALALSSSDNRRHAEVELAKWVKQEYGPVPMIFGSEGITQVVAYYSGAKHAPLMKVMDDRAVLDLTHDLKPDVILLLATRRIDFRETQTLVDKLVKLGFHETDRSRLPPGTDAALIVLGRKK
jgi:4-amino-4-deoxy-L-arabinose transferase-like glycosyltransferase